MGSAENMIIHAAASVAFAAGAPAYVWFSGAFTGVITDTGIGDVNLLFNANFGVDDWESVILLTARGALANWPRQPAFAQLTVTDVAKQILITEEAAAGGASIAADINFDVVVFKRNIV